MGRTPQVSVVIPSYNSAPFLRQTLESVRRQTFTDWEIVVVDDCSTDASPALVEDMARRDVRVRLLRLARNAGRPAVPRNAGVQAARGAYVAFLDADDLWHPQKLELQMQAMREHGVRFVSTDIHRFRNEAEVAGPLASRLGRETAATAIDHRRLLRKNSIPTSSVLVERALLLHRPFIEDPRYKAIEDYHCWLNIHQHDIDRSCKLGVPLVYYRLAQSSISKSKARMFGKNYLLYSEYLVNGRGLGLRKYFYLGTYVWGSLADRLGRMLSRSVAYP